MPIGMVRIRATYVLPAMSVPMRDVPVVKEVSYAHPSMYPLPLQDLHFGPPVAIF